MPSVKKHLKQYLAVIPPIGRLLAERDTLRQQVEILERRMAELRVELKAVRTKFEIPCWVPPGHFYSPIPWIPDLKMNEEEVFDLPPMIRGIDLNEEAQVDLLRRFGTFYPSQPFTPNAVAGRRYFFENPNYSYNDAIVLYCMMRHLRPRRIVEVGSGHSSCAILDVNELLFDNGIRCTFIDPFPQLLSDLIGHADHPSVRILGRRVQDVNPSVFKELQDSDILFIDSSHVSKTGSDVNYLIFKVLPLLDQGVYIHFHDIFYPFEYPAEWVYEGRGWNEAYLLRAFLQYNRAFEIQFFNSFMIWKYRDLFESEMPLCLERIGANLWVKKTAHDPKLDRPDARAERKPKQAPSILELTRDEHACFLGDGWYIAEPDHCWMSGAASIQIAGPRTAGARLVIRALSPHPEGASLSATVEGIAAGTQVLGAAGGVSAEFPLPDDVIGRPTVSVHLEINRVHTVAGDPRKLGLAVSQIAVVE